MKKILLGIAVFVLIAGLLATPVFAVPSEEKKVPVIQWSDGGTAVAGDKWMNNGNISFNRGASVVYKNSHLSINDGATVLIGSSSNTFDEILQRDRETGGYTGSKGNSHYDVDWNYPAQNGFSGGGFKGVFNAHFDDFILYVIPKPTGGVTVYYTMNMRIGGTLQGYGAFEGQTLQISFDGFYDLRYPSNTIWEGYIFKP